MKSPYKYICTDCGSDNVRWDAWAVYDEQTQQMELDTHFDDTHCINCDGVCSVQQVPVGKLKIRITVRRNIPFKDLHILDQQEGMADPHTPFWIKDYEFDTPEEAMDEFHDTVAIKVLDDFDISWKILEDDDATDNSNI